jgi:tripartite-type tricarboxylate transporter receptor subunit TctC
MKSKQLLFMLMGLALVSGTQAAGYPEKVITVIVLFPPGGSVIPPHI